jgi:hypothetical protein
MRTANFLLAMGELVSHEIVSNFDTILVLKRPCINFADWANLCLHTSGDTQGHLELSKIEDTEVKEK